MATTPLHAATAGMQPAVQVAGARAQQATPPPTAAPTWMPIPEAVPGWLRTAFDAERSDPVPPAPAPDHAASPVDHAKDDHANDGNERSWLAGTSVALSTGLGLGKGWILDRGRLGVSAFLQARTGPMHPVPAIVGAAVGLPLMVKGGLDLKSDVQQQGLAAFTDPHTLIGVGELAGGAGALGVGLKVGMPSVRWKPIVLDLFRGPSTASVPTEGGIWNLWGKTYRASNVLGSSLGALALFAGVTNLVDAWRHEGIEGTLNSKAGRTGVLQILGAGIGFGYSGWAGMFHRLPGESFTSAAVGAEWLAEPGVRNVRYAIGLGFGLLTIANELHALDFMNPLFRHEDD